MKIKGVNETNYPGPSQTNILQENSITNSHRQPSSQPTNQSVPKEFQQNDKIINKKRASNVKGIKSQVPEITI